MRFRNPLIPIGAILGLDWDNGKENGNYSDYKGYTRVILGLYRHNGTENGNNYNKLYRV